METRANYVLIGAFTLAVIAAGFGFVLWFQSLHSTKMRTPLRVIFEGSASGLRVGGSVNFNGVRIGEVTSVKIDDPKRVVAIAMVEGGAPLRNDTMVGLEFQGLTGVAAIALKGGSLDAPPVAIADDGVPTLTADPSALQDVMQSVRATLQTINKVVQDNQETINSALKNVEVFSASLATNSKKLDSIFDRADDVMEKTGSVMKRADSVLLGLDTLAGGKDGGELFQAVKSFRELADNLDKRSNLLIADGRRTLADISRAVNNLDRNPTRLLFGPSTSSTPAPPPPTATNERRR